jgi:hypothetical protein
VPSLTSGNLSSMRYNIVLLFLLLILFSHNIHGKLNEIFGQNTTIGHPESGLFFTYVGSYTPSDKIIHNSAIFPMTVATCHFLPLSSASKIPSCNITMKRNKRFVTDVISIGVGLTSLAISTANSMQIVNLQQQVTLVEKSLSEFSKTMRAHGALLVKLQETQIELAKELQTTQQAINAIIPILQMHSKSLESLRDSVEKLHIQFQRSFLYLALEKIFHNKLTLEFLSSDDLHSVIYDVISGGNLTFNAEYGQIPIAQIITNLLVRQQVDFVPSSRYTTMNPEEIGRLVITSYFAVPQKQHSPFYTYKLIAIPFFYENKTIQIGHIPQYWAINPIDNISMEWHDPQTSGCDLQLMTTCRDTPPMQPITDKTCLGQIIGTLPLSSCQITSIPSEPFFIRQLRDNLWVTSSPEPIHCLKIPKFEYSILKPQTRNINEQVILPPISVVNVTPGYTITCPGFTLVGQPIPSSGPLFAVIYNNSLLTNNIPIVDVYQHLKKNTSWFNVKSREQRIDDIIKRLSEPATIPDTQTFHPKDVWSLSASVISWICLGLISIALYYVYRRKFKNNIQSIRLT